GGGADNSIYNSGNLRSGLSGNINKTGGSTGSGSTGGSVPGTNGFSIASVYSANRSVTSQSIAAGGTPPAFVPAGAQPGSTVVPSPPEIHGDHRRDLGKVLESGPSAPVDYYVRGDPATPLPANGTFDVPGA